MKRTINLTIVGVIACFLIFQGALMERYGHFWGSAPEQTVLRYYQMMYGGSGLFDLKWLGIPTTQNPNDIWMIQEIIYETCPDIIIETGTGRGGSAVLWAVIQS